MVKLEYLNVAAVNASLIWKNHFGPIKLSGLLRSNKIIPSPICQPPVGYKPPKNIFVSNVIPSINLINWDAITAGQRSSSLHLFLSCFWRSDIFSFVSFRICFVSVINLYQPLMQSFPLFLSSDVVVFSYQCVIASLSHDIWNGFRFFSTLYCWTWLGNGLALFLHRKAPSGPAPAYAESKLL